MRIHDEFAVSDPVAARSVIDRHGFATIVARDLETTRMPCLAEDGEELSVLSHVAGADPFSRCVHEGARLLMIFHGPQGYVSAGWYPVDDMIPTWDHVTLEVRGRVEIVTAREVLERTVDHYERLLERPWRLRGMDHMVEQVVGFRLRAESVHLEAKLHQDKDPEIRGAAIAGLEAPGPYRNAELAAAIRAVSAGRSP